MSINTEANSKENDNKYVLLGIMISSMPVFWISTGVLTAFFNLFDAKDGVIMNILSFIFGILLYISQFVLSFSPIITIVGIISAIVFFIKNKMKAKDNSNL